MAVPGIRAESAVTKGELNLFDSHQVPVSFSKEEDPQEAPHTQMVQQLQPARSLKMGNMQANVHVDIAHAFSTTTL